MIVQWLSVSCSLLHNSLYSHESNQLFSLLNLRKTRESVEAQRHYRIPCRTMWFIVVVVTNPSRSCALPVHSNTFDHVMWSRSVLSRSHSRVVSNHTHACLACSRSWEHSLIRHCAWHSLFEDQAGCNYSLDSVTACNRLFTIVITWHCIGSWCTRCVMCLHNSDQFIRLFVFGKSIR